MIQQYMAGLLPQWAGYNLLFHKGKSKMDIQPKDTSRGHFYVSIIKSVTRIIAGITLILSLDNPYIIAAGSLLIIAELLGILEELV
jgi:hypothetical protein